MKKQVIMPKIITLEILTVVTVIIWIVFEVYRLATSRPTPNVPPEILSDFNSSIDSQALNRLDSRLFVER